jgi:hypothetical protein
MTVVFPSFLAGLFPQIPRPPPEVEAPALALPPSDDAPEPKPVDEDETTVSQPHLGNLLTDEMGADTEEMEQGEGEGDEGEAPTLGASAVEPVPVVAPAEREESGPPTSDVIMGAVSDGEVDRELRKYKLRSLVLQDELFQTREVGGLGGTVREPVAEALGGVAVGGKGIMFA